MASMIPESNEVRAHRLELSRRRELGTLTARIRRKLKAHRLHLHKSRGQRDRYLLGNYWITDELGLMPILRDVELRDLAKRIGVYAGDIYLQ